MANRVGRDAAYLKWGCGLTWDEVEEGMELGKSKQALRSAARRYRDSHREDFIKALCPVDLVPVVETVTGEVPESVEESEEQDQSEFTVEGNEAVLSYSATERPGHPIRTFEELVASHEIDLEEWALVGEVEHNAWSVARSVHQGPGFEWFQNHQVKANFVRKHPEPVFPVIHPVTPAETFDYPDPQPRGGVWREVIFGDAQIGFRKSISTAALDPFHDRAAMDIMLQIVKYLQPQSVVNLGDYLDAAELSHFTQEPAFYFTLQPAIYEGHYWLRQLRVAAPEAELVYLKGNHEVRLDNGLLNHFPAAHNLRRATAVHMGSVTSLGFLMSMDELAVEWVEDYPNGEKWSADLRYRHGDTARKNPGATARAVLEDAQSDEAFGHTHRPEMVGKVLYGRDGRHGVKAWNPGCLCRVDGAVPGSSADDHWRQGVVVRDYLPNGTLSTETFVNIENGRALFDGKLWEGDAASRLAELRAAYPNWQWEG